MSDGKIAFSVVDFGWWYVVNSLVGWRLTWRGSDRKLLLTEAGDDDDGKTINLGQYDLPDVRIRMAGWGSAPHGHGGWLDAAWLSDRFPAVAKELAARRQVPERPRLYDQDNDIDWLRRTFDGATIEKIDAAEAWSPGGAS